MAKVGVILVAAGASERIDAPYPKQFLSIGPNPMFYAAMEPFLGLVDEIVVVRPAAWLGVVEATVRPLGAGGSESTGDLSLRGARIAVVDGGARRQDSVVNGLAALPDDVEIVLIHDAARPFPSEELIDRVIEAAEERGAAVPVVPVTDTVKRVEGGRVVATEDRGSLRLAQTPQGFRRSVIEEAYRALGDADVTDDVTAVEQNGHEVAVVDGDPRNFKVTTPFDLDVAAMLGHARSKLGPGFRAGTGSDTHRLVEGRKLILCGVEIPFDKGLDGHSDADVATHAVMDALLGAVAAGDIGHHFPPDDPAFKDASSLDLLKRVVRIVSAKECTVEHVDVTVVAEAPKLAPHIERMRETLAKVLLVHAPDVSVKATTTEGLGPEGEGRAISAVAVAVVKDPMWGLRVSDFIPPRKRR